LWQLQNQPIAATRPYMVGIGNHEAWYNWTAVTSRFHMPSGPTVGAEPPFWWSMNHGLVHWVHTCSEFDLSSGSPQAEWIAADLAAAAASAQRGIVPWIVLTIHRPLYGSESSWEDLRQQLEPLISLYKVDLVLSGHIHAYERTHPVGNDGASYELPSSQDGDGNDIYYQPSFPVYITQGNSGAGQEERWMNPVPEWSAVRWANGYTGSLIGGDDSKLDATLPDKYPYTYTDTFGFGVAKFVNETAMLYESVPVTGVFSDKFWIIRSSQN
jgi:acid phosphatase type 7